MADKYDYMIREKRHLLPNIISEEFFEQELIDNLLSHKEDYVNCGIDYRDVVDESWKKQYDPWLKAVDKGIELLDQIEELYDCDRSKLIDIWVKRNIDIWDLHNHEEHFRDNSDIHKDFFEDFTKVINLQIYVSNDIPPEAGTCFWDYLGDNIEADTDDLRVAKHPYTNWKMVKQIPFEHNVAFTYNAGPDGIYHSAPLTEMLLDSEVPSHTREVIIYRFRYR